jgi:hypothetical protein
VHSGVSGTQNINALFFMFGWNRYRFDKRHIGIRYAELVFLYLVVSTGHIVHAGESWARNGDALFFMLGWDRY